MKWGRMTAVMWKAYNYREYGSKFSQRRERKKLYRMSRRAYAPKLIPLLPYEIRRMK